MLVGLLDTAGDRHARPLRRRDLDPDPLRQFERWFREAQDEDTPMPEAMALATVSPAGQPSLRMVLLKGFDERGFTFHTSYASRKSSELAENPRGALLFHWQALGRQVRIEGSVEKLERGESEEYFRTRPRGGQLAASASRQSEPIESRAALESRFRELEARYAGEEPPLPEDWGGFRLAAEQYEFWQHRENRLHDRFRYRRGRGESGWQIERLQP